MSKEHKPFCKINQRCAVYHTDGICPGPYGKCDCEAEDILIPAEERTAHIRDMSDTLTLENLKKIMP